MATQENQTASVANRIIQLLASADGLRLQINAVSTDWTNLSAATKLAAFPTALATATGALGTVDVSPDVTHPIDTRGTLAGAQLTNAISSNNIAGMLTGLQGIATVINGGSVAANGALASLIVLTR